MNKKELLSEELKRHLQLLEYTFYVPEETNEKDEADVELDLLLGGDMYLTEQDPVGDEDKEDAAPEDPFAADTGGVDTATPEGGATEDPFAADTGDVAGEVETDPFAVDDEGIEVEDELADEETVEIDVTDIVAKSEETKTSVDGMNNKMDDLLDKLSDLESQIGGMDQVIGKIDNLEKEIERRNPTPVEKLEMRSMDSFPYSVSLTDFWDDREGYEATEEEKEYTLTQSDVDNYDQKEIRNSFNSDNDEDQD
jgi:hypothetical protein